MAKKKLTEEQEKEIKILQNNYSMLEKTKKEVQERGGDQSSVRRIELAQEEVENHIKSIDKEADTKVANDDDKKQSIYKDNTPVQDAIKKETAKIQTEQKNNGSIFKSATDKIIENIIPEEKPVVVNDAMYTTDTDSQYDVLPLPSNGECYPSKIDRLPVAYMTAYDENLITSPNLYKDGLVIDFLLKNKVLSNDFDPDDLVSGDADAITWFLRTTSYGPEFPVNVTDPETNQTIETIVDLSKLKPKEFKLKGDENGHFTYTLPLSKKEVKFKYLTRKNERELQLLQRADVSGVKASLINGACETVANLLKNDEKLNEADKDKIRKATETIRTWAKSLEEENPIQYTRIITNRLEMEVQAVDGNYDREYVKQAVRSMSARDSLMLRRFINENEPGMDFEIDIERPESLGGGSFKTFLEWDDNVFLNLPEL